MKPQKRVVRVGEVMKADVDIVDGMTAIGPALRNMKFPETRTLIVDRRDEDDEFGIIMFKDIAQRVLAPDLSPERISCYEIMSKPAVGVHPKMNVRYCVQLLDRFGLSRAPVIKGRKVVGLVSYTDIVLKSVMMQD